ncbi:hypothetical protein CN373_02085 [Bacillus cereus]|nr:hypothetical protein CN373_02085 [Bacillus cereus]PFO82490.1 hypothetical protein COJ77_12500 [Bacillus cereus]PFR31690.1 hypothetical protein COK19_02600 [Bacillus cereus]PGZ18772.1 hypothetical protein COE46_06120 [Bacillus cereus]
MTCKTFYYKKAQVARLECEGDGAPDVEAFFASQEGAKPPSILATGAGLYKKRRRLLSPGWLRFFPTEGAFYLLVGKVLRREGLGAGAGLHKKAQVARSKYELAYNKFICMR